MPHIFISYPSDEEDIVCNLSSNLKELGVEAWVYSYNKTIGKTLWGEIKEKISISKLMAFVVADCSEKSTGQKRELKLALKKP